MAPEFSRARTYPAGVTSWVDVEHGDVAAAEQFYGALLGWTFTRATPPGLPFHYLIAQLDGQDVAGLGGPSDPSGDGPERPAWNTYVAVDDIDAVARSVTAAGGQVLHPPTVAGEGGSNAVCADPAGVQFRLWQANRRPGAQVTNVPGAWNFSDLHAADPTASARFYTDVFGWEIDDLGYSTLIRVPGYGDHLASTTDPGIHERQSGAMVPPGFADAIGWLTQAGVRGPGWQVSFTVADRDESAALAESLGGLVLQTEDTDWTRTAVIADPGGAVFTASQFAPPDGG
jgi:predicted enzyme related to lactoylglutathione lyase